MAFTKPIINLLKTIKNSCIINNIDYSNKIRIYVIIESLREKID